MTGTLKRYWHTLRPLRPEQVFGRVLFHLNRPHPDLAPAPPRRPGSGTWRVADLSTGWAEPDQFQFGGITRRISGPTGWNPADVPRLWLYHLHYFDNWAGGGRAEWCRQLLVRWIAENPPARGVGWEPYPLSRRIVSWTKWILQGGQTDPILGHSLAVQARYLRKRLEWHLLANHLWTNAKALVFAGALFSGKEGDHWLEEGLHLLERERVEQILPDGGHFERSPMYHALVLEDLLDLVQLAGIYPECFPATVLDAWRTTALQMMDWLAAMSHPDGGIAFFNDAVFDVAPGYGQLVSCATALGLPVQTGSGLPVVALPDSGYIRLATPRAVVIADLGPVGPDYQPGHAHADTLSFEFSLDGKRVLVNGGISTYEKGADRRRQRGSAMHNTVVVDNEDSSEVWGSFRVARRARPQGVRWARGEELLWMEGSHDGYRRLPGRVLHRRRWELLEGRLRVIDTLDGKYQDAQAFFRFSPKVRVQPAADGGSGAEIWWQTIGALRAEVRPGSWHPGFGVRVPCQVLVVTFDGPRLETEFLWNGEDANSLSIG